MTTKISPETHDLSLLETKANKELATLWNVTPKYVTQIKKKFRPDLTRKYSLTDRIIFEEKIVNWLKECNKNEVTPVISEFCKKENYNQSVISYYMLGLIANKYNLSAPSCKNELKHSYSNYCRKICLCSICKLCNTLYQRFKVKQIYIDNKKVSELAIKYYDFYVSDKSRYKREFYDMIEKELQD
jgi:hypothetical protein